MLASFSKACSFCGAAKTRARNSRSVFLLIQSQIRASVRYVTTKSATLFYRWRITMETSSKSLSKRRERGNRNSQIQNSSFQFAIHDKSRVFSIATATQSGKGSPRTLALFGARNDDRSAGAHDAHKFLPHRAEDVRCQHAIHDGGNVFPWIGVQIRPWPIKAIASRQDDPATIALRVPRAASSEWVFRTQPRLPGFAAGER